MRLTALGSSSAGNCFVMEFDMGEGRKPASLMVECGFPYQTIVKKATPYGVRLDELQGCLITHSHKDHSAGALDLAKRGVPVYATTGTLNAIGLGASGWVLHYGVPTPICDGLKVLAFRVEHDAPDPAGFVIKTKKETVLFAIDASAWLDDLSAIAADYIFIESNYDPTLMANEQFSLQKRGGLNDMQRYRLNERVKASHMSIKKTLVQLTKANKSRLKTVFLTHLSDRMSAPALWKTQAEAVTGVPCKVCRKDGGIE